MKHYTMPGKGYSAHKKAFKKILAQYGYKWSGTLSQPEWRGKGVLRAEYIKDGDLLTEVRFVFEGEDEEFLKVLEEWILEHGGECSNEVYMKIWDMTHKPDVNYLRITGCPEIWIERAMQEWEKEREKKKRVEK